MSGRLMLRKEGVRWAKLLHNIYVKGGGGATSITAVVLYESNLGCLVRQMSLCVACVTGLAW
jgi:hypothetical protein